jgi:energy-coupling factor transport system substrate-specific component
MMLGGLLAAFLSFMWTLWSLQYYQLNIGLLIAMFAVRAASAIIFTAILAKFLADRLAKTGVLKNYPIGYNQVVQMDE